MNKTKWYKISESKLPTNKYVLVLLKDGDMHVTRKQSKDLIVVGGMFHFDCSPITHWTELPDKPDS